jgi:SAM-dependent methyltransferase
MECKICNENSDLILSLDSGSAVSSLGKILEAEANIYLCSKCSHCQTNPSIDLFEYYSNEYKTLSVSFVEDDLYGYVDGVPVFRNFHQAKTLINKLQNLDKINIDNDAILDYGCGKSLIMKHLIEVTGNENVFLYDVSEDYIQYWDTFLPKSQYACFDLPAKWDGYFNLVTSFFSLEHVPDPQADLNRIRQLLKPDGYVYVIVPNMYSENTADMLVIDHIQHYSESSMNLLFNRCGFELLEADHLSHAQGSIFIGKVGFGNDVNSKAGIPISESFQKCKEIAAFWEDFHKSIHVFEEEMKASHADGYYIVGAGFIGTCIYLQLRYPELLLGFIDSNEHKQKKGWQGKQVFAPGVINGDKSNAALCGFNQIQLQTILSTLLPEGIPENNVWSLSQVKSNNKSI